MAIFLKKGSVGLSLLLMMLLRGQTYAQVEQIPIDRVEQMPNSPSPYLMRDWHDVARKYDSFVYDVSGTGQYLPLLFIKEVGTNYPENKSFGLDSYVGTFASQSSEAINVLPSLIGATLVGIDKSNQEGENWVLMSQDFFNKRPEENVYLNNAFTNSGTDWWYEVMPNIYFYQLNNLYPNIGDANFQFVSIADQWLRAVRAMGGSDAPWEMAFMNYRAWNLSAMMPLNDGVKEPEAAGGIAWLLYHAYKETVNKEYLKGAEWCLEFLDGLTSNPSYELQLPYGVYAAARMNAEIGTSYNIKKMVNWTFDRGPLRGWGAIAGQWNGIDVSGLIGEANNNGNDYAFLMNGMQQAAALVPMVRYDKRFARSIGKWMLNVSNASRLFYPGFLPSNQQDASDWSATYDPMGYIGYEGLREKLNDIPGPFSTGDPVPNGWGNTNLALYASSSVGIFGGIIMSTNIEKILRLDLLKTDYYRDEAYPTYLYFNPHPSSQTIDLDVGPDPTDIYDTVTETFLLQNAVGNITFTIPADNARVLVLAPHGGITSYELNKMLINGVVVDYMQSSQAFNFPPRIKSIAAQDVLVAKGTSTTLYATAVDPEGGSLTYAWTANDEPLSETDPTITWTAPDTPGKYEISLTVTDEQQHQTSDLLILNVVDHINTPPEIIDLFSDKTDTKPLESLELTCLSQDADNDVLNYIWTANGGTILGKGATATWESPSTEGVYEITVMVEDGQGGSAERKLNILVKDFSNTQVGSQVAWYPFSGDADDKSGNQLHGEVFGAMLSEDFQGVPENAYRFDGINDYISVPNDNRLNFADGITVSFGIIPAKLPSDRESFIISHGSWQSRWKVSITPANRVRWSLNTSTAIKDIDSNVTLEENKPYHLAVTYDGEFMLLYINGKLDSYATLQGTINPSPVDLLMAKMLPDDNNAFNYKGIIDNVRIFDYALSPKEILGLLNDHMVTGIASTHYHSVKIYPSPANKNVTIDFEGGHPWNLISIYNLYGQKLNSDSILNQYQASGRHHQINLSGLPDGVYFLHFQGGRYKSVVRIVVSR